MITMVCEINIEILIVLYLLITHYKPSRQSHRYIALYNNKLDFTNNFSYI